MLWNVNSYFVGRKDRMEYPPPPGRLLKPGTDGVQEDMPKGASTRLLFVGRLQGKTPVYYPFPDN